MKQEYIVSLNVIKNTIKNQLLIDTTLLNPNKYPILFYSNKSISFKEELDNNKDLYNLLNSISAFNYLNYTNISVNGIKYNILNQEYTEENYDVQDLFLLKNLEEGTLIADSMIFLICNKMYYRAQGDPNKLNENNVDNIKYICSYLNAIYEDEYNHDEIKNYIDNKLETVTRLNKENIKFVSERFSKIFE